MPTFDLTPAERAVYARLRTPDRIQRFLDEEVAYNKEPGGPTCRGPRRVITDRIAHCMEGALFGAAALRMIGHEPMLLDIEAVRDDDHVLALYRRDGCWGSLAKSNYAGLRFREPVYRTIRELAMSFFAHYYNKRGEKTMRGHSTRPVRLSRFDRIGWMTSERDLWEIPEYLCEVAHSRVMTPQAERRLARMDARSFGAGLYGTDVLNGVEPGPKRVSGASGAIRK